MVKCRVTTHDVIDGQHEVWRRCEQDGARDAEVFVAWNQNPHALKLCRIQQIVVNPEQQRGQGYGTYVLGLTLQEMVESGCRTFTGIPLANDFWEKFGVARAQYAFTLPEEF